MIRLFLGVFALGWVNSIPAQLRVMHDKNPTELVNQVLLQDTQSVKVLAVQYGGKHLQIGEFRADNVAYVDISRGIILSTGYAETAIGPNNHGRSGDNLHGVGDIDLTRIAKNKTSDAAVLQITFIPTYDEIKFEYIFASEEYPEYVNKGVSDVFAFILSDTKTGERKNIATLPIQSLPVAVDNVNHRINQDLFILNGIWEENNVRKFENNKELGEFAWLFQYDGLTTWLTAQSKVVPGRMYNLKIAIADVGDAVFDSAVLLKGSSFGSNRSQSTALKLEKNDLLKYFNPEQITERGDSLILTLHLNFETDRAETTHEMDLNNLEKVYQLLQHNPKLFLKIEGHTDSQGTVDYNQTLSSKRSQFALKYLVDKGIEVQRLQAQGFGLSHPIASNQSESGRAKNRRVEFVFYLGE